MCATTWMNLEDSMLREVRHRRKIITELHLHAVCGRDKLIEKDSGHQEERGWGG